MIDISEKSLGKFILITLKERTNPSPASNSPLASVLSQGSLKEKEGDPAREYEQDVWDEKHTCKKGGIFRSNARRKKILVDKMCLTTKSVSFTHLLRFCSTGRGTSTHSRVQ